VDSGETVNLFLELLSKKDAERVLNDLYSGKTVSLPKCQGLEPKSVSSKSDDPSTRIDPMQSVLTSFPKFTRGSDRPKFKYEDGSYVELSASTANVIRKFASVLHGRLREALESGKPMVFLGGECSDGNKWREEIVKEFGNKLALIDPYDENWKADDNIYDELAAILKADHVVFYKGGKGTEKEKAFLKSVGDPEDFKEFDDFGKLRTYLENLSKPVTVKTAKSDGDYDKSLAEVALPKDLAKTIVEWGKKNIPDSDLSESSDGTQGREDEIHVTVLYGLGDGDEQVVGEVVEPLSPFDVRLGLVTLFKDKKDHDVVKIDVESPDLQKLHYTLVDTAGVKTGYPTYVPHVTVAYVKKGAGDKVLGSEEFRGKVFKVQEVIFKGTDKHEIKILLKGRS